MDELCEWSPVHSKCYSFQLRNISQSQTDAHIPAAQESFWGTFFFFKWNYSKHTKYRTWQKDQSARSLTRLYLEWVSESCSVVSSSLPSRQSLYADCSPPGSLSKEFSRPEYWSELPFPVQEIFPTQGSNPGLQHCWQDSLPSETPALFCNDVITRVGEAVEMLAPSHAAGGSVKQCSHPGKQSDSFSNG